MPLTWRKEAHSSVCYHRVHMVYIRLWRDSSDPDSWGLSVMELQCSIGKLPQGSQPRTADKWIKTDQLMIWVLRKMKLHSFGCWRPGRSVETTSEKMIHSERLSWRYQYKELKQVKELSRRNLRHSNQTESMYKGPEAPRRSLEYSRSNKSGWPEHRGWEDIRWALGFQRGQDLAGPMQIFSVVGALSGLGAGKHYIRLELELIFKFS